MSAIETQELAYAPDTPEPMINRPWPRYFARMLDIIVLSTIVTFIAAVIAGFVAPEPALRLFTWMESGYSAKFFSNVIAIALALPPIALLLARGQTPGKWLFGIRVTKQDGSRMGLKTSLHRELLVWIKGLALGVPAISMIMLFMSHSTLTDDGITSWDKQLQCRVTHVPATTWWWIRATLGGAIVIAASIYGAIGIAFDK